MIRHGIGSRFRRCFHYVLLSILFVSFLQFPTIFGAATQDEIPPASSSADDESLISQSGKQHFLDAMERIKTPGAKLSRVQSANKKPPPPFVLADVQMECAEGWERQEGKCLKSVPIERSWPQALAFCARYGAVLARVESTAENAFLSKLFSRPQRSAGTPGQSEHWIGLLHRPAGGEDGTDGGTFLWSDGTETSRYIGHWARGQPDPAGGSCTKAILGSQSTELSWSLDVCNLLLPFACERSACLKGSFFCHNGACVPEQQARCNGVDDCGDFSDELNCPTSHGGESACQRYEKAESGRVESPNFPNPYRAGTNCRWVLEGPINSRIQIIFESFETEENQDLVTVVDGGPAENASIALATLSGTPRAAPQQTLSFESSSNRMVIRFRADQTIQARGFQANWRTVSASCGGHLNAQSLSQQLNSPEWPRPYPNGVECVWRIQAPEGQLISLTIDELDVESERDFLTIYDGPHPSAPVLTRISGKLMLPQLLVSTLSRLYVYFFSSQSGQRKGFSIGYKKGCDNLIRRSHGVLTSPGGAHLPYAPAQTCRWTIEPPGTVQMEGIAARGKNNDDGTALTLAVNSWDVADSGDSLQVFDGTESDEGGGKALHPNERGFSVDIPPPKTIFARQNRVELVWRANGLGQGTGWNMSFSISCAPLSVPSRRVQLSTRNTAYGTRVTVSCERGHEFVTGRGRHFELRCEMGGRWVGDDDKDSSSQQLDSSSFSIPECQPVYCSAIPQIANGFAVSATNVSFAGLARFQCYKGFAFPSGKEHEEIFCTEEGRWTPAPKCKTTSCPILPAFAFGERTLQHVDGIGYGSVYGFECGAGYRREGPPSIVCQPDGQWTSGQPQCKKLRCTELPVVENGELQWAPAPEEKAGKGGAKEGKDGAQKRAPKRTEPIRELEYGEWARVECRPGFRSMGAETVKCLANQTLSGVPECLDIDECAEQMANCAAKSSQCVNMPGGYHCQCQPGYSPQLSCASIGQTSLQPMAGHTALGVPIPVQQIVGSSKSGWCQQQNADGDANATNANGTTSIPVATFVFVFPVPKIIEKLRIERVLPDLPSGAIHLTESPSSGGSLSGAGGIFPVRFVLSSSMDEGVAPKVYIGGLMAGAGGGGGGKNGSLAEGKKRKKKDEDEEDAETEEMEGMIRIRSLGFVGSEVLAFAEPIEARTVQLEVFEFNNGGTMPCLKLEFLGCQRTSCEDVNECADGRNGGCAHQCHNVQGTHRCSCEEGFDLFTQPGQGGVRLEEGETGLGERDSLRFGRSCVPRHCPPLSAPDHGQLITSSALAPADNSSSSASSASSFPFPTIVEFRCAFGHQMRGASHLKCMSDGSWNGTMPSCIPATCPGVRNNTAIGLFVDPDSVSIPYGHNLSFVCSQTNRPPRRSALGAQRQCVYDPRTDGAEYWLSGAEVDCPLVDCGPPPAMSGAYYEATEGQLVSANFKVGSVLLFQCRAPYVLVGKSSYDDRMVRCSVDASWDLGDLRCEGPVCVDPGHPDDGRTLLDSVEEGAVTRFTCNRPGYAPFPGDALACALGTACVLAEDVGISSGFIPDGAFADNSDKTIWGYEPHKARMSASGWCGSKDAFIFLSVELQRIYTLTTLRLTGVAGSGHLAGHVTKMQLFHKVQFSQNYDNYPMEFTTPSGNHKRMYQFQLDPPVRARYILLGISEYERNPCLKFDLHGCLAPQSATHEVPAHLQVGWNASVPQCVDAEPPRFRNCPAEPVLVQTDEHGQLLPVMYAVPEAEDNSGRVAYTRSRPEEFVPPFPVNQDTDVVYQAFDDAGNMAECVVRIRIPDTVPPIVKCPDSYALWAAENQTEQHIKFNESTVRLAVQDVSPIASITFDPPEAIVRLHQHVTVEVSVTDAHSNRNKCKFQLALVPEPCAPWALAVDERSVQKECQRHATGTRCQLECRKGHRFVGIVPQKRAEGGVNLTAEEHAAPALPQRYTCNLEEDNKTTQLHSGAGQWLPSQSPPACVPIAMEPARYELRVHMLYVPTTPVPSECLKGYEFMLGSMFDAIDQVLSQRCSSTVQIYVRFLDAKFSATDDEKMIGANLTLQVLPTVLQPVFYELCSLTLRTIFDQRIPGASQPIRALLALVGDSVPAPQGLVCPSMNATGIQISQGFTCSNGELLKDPREDDPALAPAPGLPECLPCPRGTFFANNTCTECPRGTFQDREGQERCRPCPEGTNTHRPGALGNESCQALCGQGMHSASGMIPCQLCPRHTFAGPPPPEGFRQCQPCPEGTYTAKLGSTGPDQCKQPCNPGHFSVSGLEPCSPCPVNFYQPAIGQQRCLQCPNDTRTAENGRFSLDQCQKLDCQSVKCMNRGQCVVTNHKEVCECRPGYTGSLCEQQIPLCDSKPCLNGGTCELHNGGFRCICAQNFTGSRCQFGPDECIAAAHCPNGGVCQDLPGLGTTKCICRTGFTGADCSEIADPCQSEHPCRNGADCIPLQLGRYKCKCLPGWEGPDCERNIDDCADSPCALGAKCHDLVNDFECECPQGFSGKRCQIKDDLCESSPCLNGAQCVDMLFERRCVCRPGWTGKDCEQELDECTQKNGDEPCQNGATCRDRENGFDCECAPGYHGQRCQYPVDHCAAGPCRNNATCTNRGATYECQCRLGYEGVHCEREVDECEALAPCDGTGTERCEDRVHGWHCHCRAGYEGVHCERHVNQCEAQPCQNNASCADMGPDGIRCECAPGWSGDRCERMESQCAAVTERKCQNEGKCVPLVDDYFCVCPEGVSGKQCELAPNRCLGEPCRNGGVCGDFGSRSECACPKGFTGVGCQFRLDACRSGACRNGGTCVPEEEAPRGDKPRGYRCLCAPGFAGADCEQDIDECQPSPCPLAAQCVDLVNGYHCKCPFNMTGANCEKRVDPDYDLHFLQSAHQPARAALSLPFRLASGSLTLSLWARFDRRGAADAGAGRHGQQRAPVFFTLYASGHPNQPMNFTELVRISADAVHVRLFPDILPLILHFPAHQRPDSGHSWHHLVFSWSSPQGAYSLVWNAVRLYADKGYAKGAQLDANAWINLGDPLDDADPLLGSAIPDPNSDPAPSRFAGSLTRVNVWARVLDFEQEIPPMVQRCQGAPVLFDGLLVRFAGYDRVEGKVERVVKSTCGRAPEPQCRADSDQQQRCTESEAEESGGPAVEVDECPEDIFVETREKEVNVSWKEPTFTATRPSVEIARVEQNLKPGQVFSWGHFSALYVALDNRSVPLASCRFSIRVSRQHCADPDAPVNGVQHCEHWGPALRFRACSIQCLPGHGFSQPPAVFYVCADDGEWRPNEAGLRPFRYPPCTRASPAERLARIRLAYPQLALCNPSGKSTLSEKLLQRIAQLDAKWHLCAGGDSGEGENGGDCSGVQVHIHCQDSSSQMSRSKRQTPGAEQFAVTIDVPIRLGPILADTSTEGPQQLREAVDVIREEALQRGLFSLEQVLPNGRPDLGTFRVDDAFRCPSGFVLLNNSCVPCAPGTFFFVPTGQCQLCPSGQFQPLEGQSACDQCPSERPITVGLGAIGQNECRVHCPPGHHLDIASGGCEPCGFGFFQPDSGSTDCIPCGIGKTTLERTSTSEEQCLDECPDGEQLTAGGNCQPCPLGTFRTRGRDKQCVECPPGTTTEDVGASRKEACNTPKCQPGQFLVASEKRCEFCARGTFQDQPLQAQCKKCPPAYNTAKEGATRESQCYSTDQCALGQDNCSWNAQCIDLPDDRDEPSWRCVCNPGFRGNGVNCTDACQNFCLNDGVCRKNRLGHVECHCKENFSGERCEIRFQPRSQRLAQWTGAIVAVVFLLIVIIVVIWMISLRFSRSSASADLSPSDKKFFSSLEKPSVFSALGPGPGPPDSNFLYGRAPVALPLDHHPHQSPPSIGRSPAIGFYYEDEQPYEMGGGGGGGPPRHVREGSQSQETKSLFLGGPDGSETGATTMAAQAGGEGGQSPGGGGGSESGRDGFGGVEPAGSATRELEQRLRHVQQHMYRPLAD